MNRRETAAQLIKLYGVAVRLGFNDEDSAGAEVVALAVGSLLKGGDNDG